jgi:GNAT superfamily N-acetyltransferase
VAIEIRRAQVDDWPAWRQIRLRSLKESPEAFRSTHVAESAQPDEWWEQRVRTSTAGPNNALWLATLQGEPAGILSSRVDPDSGVMTAEAIWVAPEARGRGVAEGLLRSAMAWGKEVGARTAELWVNQGNSATRSLYRRAGFRPTTEVQQVRPGYPHIILKMSTTL